MKMFSFFMVFACLSVTSCRHSQDEQVFISAAIEYSHGAHQVEAYSLIHVKQDSLYYYDFPNLNEGMYLGKINTKNSMVETNGSYEIEIRGNKLNVYENDIIVSYALLDKPIETNGLDKDYFVGKKYAIKSKFVNDTIIFISENTYLDSTDNKEFKWSSINFEGYKFLWQENRVEEVPLQIVSVNDSGFKAMFYGLEQIEVVFKEVP